MKTASTSPAERRYALFLTMVHLGAVATLLLIATLAFDLPSFVDGLPLGVIMVRKLRDDYVEQLWKAGTASAFVAVIICFLVAPLTYGVLDDLIGGGVAWREYGIPVQLPAAVALIGFYAGFYWRLLAGGQEA